MHHNRITNFVRVSINLLIVLVMILSMSFWRVQKAAAVGDPRILTRANEDRIAGFDWAVDSTITIEVDDPLTASNPDKTVYATGGTAPWDPNVEWFETNINDYDLKPGDIVTMSNSTSSKQLTIENLLITEFDLDTEVVHGTADPGQLLYIQACDDNSCAIREETADQGGNWTANFAVPGEGVSEQDTADLRGGIWLDANINDGDGDMSRFALSVPSPNIVARLTLNQVDAGDWPAGTLLTLTVEDQSTELSPDYTNTSTSQLNEPQDPNSGTSVNFDFGNNYILKSGDQVTVTGGDFTRTTTVADIHVTNVDVDNDIISGTAGTGILSVNVRLWSSPLEMQRDAEVVNGVWSVDFSVPSSEYGTYNIKPGDSGVARWFEGDGDFTTDYWEVPNPTFGASARWNHIFGDQWPLGDTITLTIDDPSNGQGIDFQQDTVAEPAPWDPNQSHVDFYPIGFQIQPGHVIELTNGEITKSLIVTYIEITSVDLQTDVVTGLSDPTTDVFVYLEGEPFGFTQRGVTSGLNGTWSVDFSVPDPNDSNNMAVDITPGINVGVIRSDEDADLTEDNFVIEPPQCQPGNTVSGTVYEHDGTTPLPYANIQIENFNTGEILFTTRTDQNGLFGCSLPNGDYRIQAVADNYSREYFDQARDTNAALLNVITGAQLTNINFTLSRLPTMEHLTFNLDNLLLQELSVRQAIFLGTNRQEILNEAFLPYNNFGVVSNSIVPPEHWAAAPASELTLYPYDPTQAGAILDAAGWVNRDADVFRENIAGTELAFTFKTTPALVRVASAEFFRQQMEQIGIRITVEHIPPGEFFADDGPLAQGNFDIAEFAWGGSFDDETYLEPYITGENQNGYSNATFDAAMTGAEFASSETEKLPFYFEAQSILTQDIPIIPLFTRYDVAPVATDPGTDVTISPEAYLNITFAEVTESGVTTVLETTINPDDLPPNFQLLGTVYDVGTSASFTSAQVCFSYDDTGLTEVQEDVIQLLHLENNIWVNVTDSGYPNTTDNVVCGTVTSFSPFAVMTDTIPPTITWVGNINHGESFYFGFVPAAPTCTADDPSGVDGPCMVTGYASMVGTHTLTATASDTIGNVATETRTYSVLAWTLRGFFQPVDMNGVYNLVKNGSTVPLKFEIFAGATELTDPVYFKSLIYVQTTCDATVATDEIETTVTDGTGLRYDEAGGQFIYNWKTPKTAGACYRLTLTTDDGSTLVAYFKLK